MEKTGSKSIQTWLADNRKNLAGEGWHIPTTLGAINHRQVSFLGYDVTRRDDGTQRRGIYTDQQLKQFKKEILVRLKNEVQDARKNGAKAMLISTELATSRLTKKREIRRLFKKLREADAGPILVTLFRRDPVELLESRHSTAILHEGWTKAHPPKAGSKLANKFGDQKTLQKKWWEVINKFNNIDFDVYNYSRKVLIEGSSAATVATMMGCRTTMIKTAVELKANQPLPLINLIGLRFSNWINQRKTPLSKEQNNRLKKFFLKNKILGRLKYKLPEVIRQSYRTAYKASLMPAGDDWLLWSSWIQQQQDTEVVQRGEQ
tara:strand:- start:3302 stop:4258 length:957 start_codon:yes stop_codon:yes gene_type:complete